MKCVYPVVIYKKGKDKYHCVYVPDIDSATQGEDLAECFEMARDLIGIEYIEEGKNLPKPFTSEGGRHFYDFTDEDVERRVLVDIDLEEYKRKNDQRIVKKNCSIPSYLAYRGEQAGLNFSKVLQDGLKRELHL